MANTLDKALDIVSALMNGSEVKRNGENANLYEEFALGTEVYDYVMTIFHKLNIDLYEYNNALYISAGDNNKVFGYTNEELKREIGVRLNRELYLCYFIIYQMISIFYKDAKNRTYAEYIKSESVISAVDQGLFGIVKKLRELSLEEVEENSFKEIAMVWEDMPLVQSEDVAARASRGSKTGFVKLVFNFMVSQGLLMEAEGRYYPKEKLKALIENYYDAHRGRLYEIMRGEEDAADKQNQGE